MLAHVGTWPNLPNAAMIEVMWVGCYADDYYHDLDFGPQATKTFETFQTQQPLGQWHSAAGDWLQHTYLCRSL